MRHRKLNTSLNRTKSHRKATIKNMMRGILTNERIVTTLKKAKVLSRWTDKMITLSKKNNLAAIRRAESILQDKDLIFKLFHEIGPRFAERNGGYTRVIKYKNRRGDGSELAILELTEREVMSIEETERKKKTESKSTKTAVKAEQKTDVQLQQAVVEVEAEEVTQGEEQQEDSEKLNANAQADTGKADSEDTGQAVDTEDEEDKK